MSHEPALLPGARLRVRIEGRVSDHPLSPGALLKIGRRAGVDLQIVHTSISREHCVVVLSDGILRVNDLDSTHGLIHHGNRVDQCQLQPGESCRIGDAVLEFALSPPEVETNLATAPIPQRIGSYRIIEKLGEGGFGTVYRAEQELLHREVALKVLKPSDDNAQQRVAAFLAEARAAARLNSPHLVEVYDVGEADGRHFLSMALVEGGSLVRRIRSAGPLNWQEVIELLGDIARALVTAHEAGIVHRDIKPANILLDHEGRAKLADLGMATSIGHGGTVAFMAPEQLRRGRVDARSDLYALGVTAYAALTGRPPFQGSKSEIAKAQVHDDPPPLHESNVFIPWQLQQLILDSLLAKAPQDRPPSARALLERLATLNLAETAESLHSGGGRSSRRHRPEVPLGRRLVEELLRAVAVTVLVVATLLLLKQFWGFDLYAFLPG